MAKRVASLGVPQDRIHVISNWADGALIKPCDPSDNRLRQDWGLAGKFVVGYSGNLGRAHEYATFLDAIERIESRQVEPTSRAEIAAILRALRLCGSS